MTTLMKEPMHVEGPVRKAQLPALGVSAYDRVAGVLIAVLCIAACAVGLMLMVWFSGPSHQQTPPLNVTVLDVGSLGGGGPGDPESNSDKTELEEPRSAELLKTETPKFEDVLDAVSLQASTQAAAELTIEELSPNGVGKTKGPGVGDREGPSVDRAGSDGIQSWERWEVQLNANTAQQYASQLDFFKIELAVAGGGSPVVTYVSNLSGKPQIRTGNPGDEKRLRFMHRSGALRDADRRLLSDAGVDHAGKVVFQFYSQETYDMLLALENAAMRPHTISEVRRTVFGVRGSVKQFEFYVISQEYR